MSALLQKLIGRIAVIRAIAKETVDPTVDLIQKIGQDRDVADILVGQFRGDDVTVVRIDAKMELLPGAARFPGLPFDQALLSLNVRNRWARLAAENRDKARVLSPGHL